MKFIFKVNWNLKKRSTPDSQFGTFKPLSDQKRGGYRSFSLSIVSEAEIRNSLYRENNQFFRKKNNNNLISLAKIKV